MLPTPTILRRQNLPRATLDRLSVLSDLGMALLKLPPRYTFQPGAYEQAYRRKLSQVGLLTLGGNLRLVNQAP